MDYFEYREGQLHCEDFNLDELVQQTGTPLYVYSKRTFEEHFDRLNRAFAPLDPLICYSVKSCGNVHICRLLADRGAGMDVVSGGELFRAQMAKVPMSKVVYAGVGKTDSEIRTALSSKIGWFNIESEAEFENICRIARQTGAQAKVALRVNPNVADPKTHAKTSTGHIETKFGVDIDRAGHFFELYGRDPHVHLAGIHIHIGSPIYTPQPYVDAIEKVLQLVEQLRAAGSEISAINIGGGFAADYDAAKSPSAAEYAEQIVPVLQPFHDAGGLVLLEPGRTIMANAGVLLTRVQYIKVSGRKKFVIVDSGMSHLARVALYDAYHFIWPTNVAPAHVPTTRSDQSNRGGLERCDICGPICETGDCFAKQRPLPPVARGDLLCIFSAGAYGMVMASNYNATPRPPEALVSGDQVTLIRRGETYDDLVRAELECQPV